MLERERKRKRPRSLEAKGLGRCFWHEPGKPVSPNQVASRERGVSNTLVAVRVGDSEAQRNRSKRWLYFTVRVRPLPSDDVNREPSAPSKYWTSL